MIAALLIVLVPTYKFNNNQDNDSKLIYSNIESVSIQINVPMEQTMNITLNKTRNLFDNKYTIKNVDVVVYDNPANYEELFTRLAIIILFKNGKSLSLSRTSKLLLSTNNSSLYMTQNKLYLCFMESGTYDIEFYIENEIGYIGAYLSN